MMDASYKRHDFVGAEICCYRLLIIKNPQVCPIIKFGLCKRNAQIMTCGSIARSKSPKRVGRKNRMNDYIPADNTLACLKV